MIEKHGGKMLNVWLQLTVFSPFFFSVLMLESLFQ